MNRFTPACVRSPESALLLLPLAILLALLTLLPVLLALLPVLLTLLPVLLALLTLLLLLALLALLVLCHGTPPARASAMDKGAAAKPLRPP